MTCITYIRQIISLNPARMVTRIIQSDVLIVSDSKSMGNCIGGFQDQQNWMLLIVTLCKKSLLFKS